MLREIVERSPSYIAETVSEPRPGTLSMILKRAGDEYADSARSLTSVGLSGFWEASALHEMRTWQFVLLQGIRNARQAELVTNRMEPIELIPGESVKIPSFDPKAEHMPLDDVIHKVTSVSLDLTLLEGDEEGNEDTLSWQQYLRDLNERLPELAQPA